MSTQKFLSQNLNLARFVRNVACDFFYDFQTQWITWNVPLWIWVVICHKKQLARNEWLLVVISNTTVLRIQASKSPKGIAASAFVATTIPADTFHPHLPCWEGVCWDKQRLKTWYGNIFIIQTLQNTKTLLFSFPWELFKNIKRNFESRIVARVMKILFLSWGGDFFSNVVLLFLRVAFFTVLARFHSCFHFFIMVCLTKIVGLFL